MHENGLETRQILFQNLLAFSSAAGIVLTVEHISQDTIGTLKVLCVFLVGLHLRTAIEI